MNVNGYSGNLQTKILKIKLGFWTKSPGIWL
jgi:hypothetical protein